MADNEIVSQDFQGVFLLTMMQIVGDCYMFGDIIPVKRDTYILFENGTTQ